MSVVAAVPEGSLVTGRSSRSGYLHMGWLHHVREIGGYSITPMCGRVHCLSFVRVGPLRYEESWHCRRCIGRYSSMQTQQARDRKAAGL